MWRLTAVFANYLGPHVSYLSDKWPNGVKKDVMKISFCHLAGMNIYPHDVSTKYKPQTKYPATKIFHSQYGTHPILHVVYSNLLS